MAQHYLTYPVITQVSSNLFSMSSSKFPQFQTGEQRYGSLSFYLYRNMTSLIWSVEISFIEEFC